jgi:uncharacterized membrane protein
LLAAVMVGIGAVHFTSPAELVAIVPGPFSEGLKHAAVAVSGVFEIAGGVGLLPRRLRRVAALGLVLLYVAVFPANVNVAWNDLPFLGAPTWAKWARLPFQAVFIAWALRYARRAPQA